MDADNEDSIHDEILAIALKTAEGLRSKSERGLILVIVAHIENAISESFTSRLVPAAEKSDELMNFPGPVSTFSSKINFAYRLGLMAKSERSIMHQLRKLRNNCAHDIDEQTFNTDHFRMRILNMIERSKDIWAAMKKNVVPPELNGRDFATVEEYVDALGWRVPFTFYFSLLIAQRRFANSHIEPLESIDE